MKGFKDKSGKFRPTGSKSKSTLKKSDVRHKKSASSSSGSGDEMKEKKMPEIKFEVENVRWSVGESYGIRHEVGDFGEIIFPDGFSGGIEDLGGQYLDEEDVAQLINMDNSTDWNEEDVEKDMTEATQGYAGDKQDNNTYNQSASLDKQVNFGIFTIDGDPYISIKEHSGHGDVRAGYGDDDIYKIQDADIDGIYAMLSPELDITLKATIKGKEETVDVLMDGGMSGFFNWNFASGTGIPDDVEKSIAGEYDKRIQKKVEEFLEKENKN